MTIGLSGTRTINCTEDQRDVSEEEQLGATTAAAATTTTTTNWTYQDSPRRGGAPQRPQTQKKGAMAIQVTTPTAAAAMATAEAATARAATAVAATARAATAEAATAEAATAKQQQQQ